MGRNTQRALSACMVIGLLVLTLLVPSRDAAGASRVSMEIELAATEYADYFHVDMETARRDVELTNAAGRLQEQLLRQFPDHFAGLWIERSPGFGLVVAMTANHDADIDTLAGSFLSPFVTPIHHPHSLRDLEAAAASLPNLNVPSAVSTDLVTNQVVIEVLPASFEAASEALARFPASAVVRVSVTSSLPLPVADIYGGLDLNAYCGGLGGTSGFSVLKNGTSTKGILTAGHLDNCLRYGGTNLSYQAGSTSGNADAQWHVTSVHTDQPKFRINESGATRPVYAVRSYSNVVNGQLVCKYGRTTKYGCGTVEAKGVDPDGPFGPLNGVFVRVQNCAGPSISEPGDSGGPVFSANTAIGIITHKDGDIFCGYKMLFNSITHTNATLGVSILISP